jgi:hypothetical protein
MSLGPFGGRLLLPALILQLLLGALALPRGGWAQQVPGAVEGQILGRQGPSISPLPNAVVDASSGRHRLTVASDAAGRYTLAGLAPGRWRIRAMHVGYREMAVEVQVPPGASVSLDVELRWEPVALTPLLVRGEGVRPLTAGRRAPPAELGEVALRALEGTSGMVEGGMAEVVRALPGHDPADPRDVLLMRGSANDLKLVLLDGAPIYTPFHMAGLVESFDPMALGGASLFLGGAPARFDGGLSYIMDLQARSPRDDRIAGTAAMDLLTGRALLEGPLTTSVGFLLGSRTIHNLGAPVLASEPSPYGYGDVLARLEWQGDGGRGAFLTGFWNRESIRLDLLPDPALSPTADTDPGTLAFLGSSPAEDGARWGNHALSGGFRTDLGQATGEVRIAASRYDARLPVGDTLPLFARGRSDRFRATADISTPWGQGALRLGASLDRMVSTYAAVSLENTSAPIPTRLDLDGLTAGAYVEGSRPLAPSVSLRGGIRVDRFAGDDGIRMAPRLSLTWMLTEDAALTLAAGRYHQYSNMASGDVERTLEGTSPEAPAAGVSPPLTLQVGAANHLVVSLDQILLPGVRLGLEGFVKEFSGLSGDAGPNLNASGVDLRVAREGERTAGWLGYSLTWFWASQGLLAPGSSLFSGRHLLSAGLTARVTDRTGLRLRAGYGQGLPFTSVPLFSGDAVASPEFAAARNLASTGDQILNSAPELTAGPDEGFLRLEVEVHGLWTPTVSGRTMELRPYIRVLNALNRRDALFYHFEPWRGEGPEPLASLPVLPLLGLEWRF